MKQLIVFAFVAWFTAAALIVASAQVMHTTDVKFGQRTIAVADPFKRRITLLPGIDFVCIPQTDGPKCRTMNDVAAWILEDQP